MLRSARALFASSASNIISASRSAPTISTPSTTNTLFDAVIVGGGAGGLAVQRVLASKNLKCALIEPLSDHFYQPGFTLVGAGQMPLASTRRDEASLVDRNIPWIRDAAAKLHFSENSEQKIASVETSAGEIVSGKTVILAAGIESNWGAVEGLEDALADPKGSVCSNYSYRYAESTWRLTQDLSYRPGSKAVFTQPATPIKCGGGPQKAMYMSEAFWRQAGLRDVPGLEANAEKEIASSLAKSVAEDSSRDVSVHPIDVQFFTGMSGIFPCPHYAQTLNALCDERGLKRRFQHDLIAVVPNKGQQGRRGRGGVAVFRDLAPDANGRQVEIEFDFLHVVPPMRPHTFLRESVIADPATGFVEVDKHTLQHKRFANVFALGDCASLPTSKTAAAVAAQVPVLSYNLEAYLKDGCTGDELPLRYDGYSACPIPTEPGKLILAEFDYDLKPVETFGRFIDQREPHLPTYLLKKHVFPAMYWNGIVQGVWHGPTNVWGSKLLQKQEA